jgi:hypothetical protein
MWLIDRLAEEHIRKARVRGEFDNLPGAGRPLVLDDDAAVPEELRAGHRLLRNSGYLTPEVLLYREISRAEQLLALAREPGRRADCLRRITRLVTSLNLVQDGPENLHLQQACFENFCRRGRQRRGGCE